MLCLYRFALPAAEIRIAGGREVHLRSLQPLGMYPANSLFVSDYLTTAGRAAEEDYAMIADLGFELVAVGHEDRIEEAGFAADASRTPADRPAAAATA